MMISVSIMPGVTRTGMVAIFDPVTVFAVGFLSSVGVVMRSRVMRSPAVVVLAMSFAMIRGAVSISTSMMVVVCVSMTPLVIYGSTIFTRGAWSRPLVMRS